MPDEAATKCLLQSVMTFLGGGLVGTILGHFLAIGRDARNRKHAEQSARKARKSSLEAFLTVWESEVDRNLRVLNSANVWVTISGQFDAKRSQLIEKAVELESDYEGEDLRSFKRLRHAVTDMTAGEVDSEEGRNKLFQAISRLAMFVRKH